MALGTPGLLVAFAIINSSPPSIAYMHRWTRSALIQIMVCRLVGTKPLPKPMLGYCRKLERQEQTLIKIQHFSFTKIHLKISSAIRFREKWVDSPFSSLNQDGGNMDNENKSPGEILLPIRLWLIALHHHFVNTDTSTKWTTCRQHLQFISFERNSLYSD